MGLSFNPGVRGAQQARGAAGRLGVMLARQQVSKPFFCLNNEVADKTVYWASIIARAGSQ